MASKKKPVPPSAAPLSILNDDLVDSLKGAVGALLGPGAMELVSHYGLNVEDTIRYMAVGHRCKATRERMGLDLKSAASQIGVPQYRLRNIEAGHIKQIHGEVLNRYLDFLMLRAWYQEWALANPELANRLASVPAHHPGREGSLPQSETVTPFRGEIVAVKARIRLIRSFDQISHQYQGYTLLIANSGEQGPPLRVAIGPAAHASHQFRIGDIVSGKGHPVPDPHQEWADIYKVSGLRVERRGPEEQNRTADPDGGIAPPLDTYRENGHRRLDPRTCNASCTRCPFGLTMATEIIIDHWNPSKKRWRFETHCFGRRDCPRHRSGAARKVPGRKPGMVWVDDDVEREG